MVVVITSTGGVTKRLFTFARPVDPGLADWAASYLNERLVGLGLGARMLHQRLHDPSLSAAEASSSTRCRRCSPTSRSLAGDPVRRGHRAAAAQRAVRRRVRAQRADGHARAPRARCSACCARRSSERDVLVRIGAENDAPALRSLALVAAGYGLPQRRLGAVSVIGPLRMDYGRAIRSVREAAASCRASSPTSTTSGDGPAYSADERDPRLLRGARRLPRRRRGRDQEGVPPAGPRAASRRQQPRPARRGEVQGGRRGLRGAVGSRPARDLRPLRPRGSAQRRLRPELRGVRLGGGHLRGVLRRLGRVRRPLRRRRAGRRRVQGGDVAVAAEIDLAEAAHGTTVEVGYEAVALCEHCRGNGAEPGTPIETCPRCGGTGQLRAVSRTPFGQVVRATVCDACHGDGRVPKEPCKVCRGPRPQGRARQGRGRRAGRDRRRPADPHRRPRPRRRAGRPAGRPVRPGPRARGPAVRPRRRRPGDRGRRRGAAGGARHDGRGADGRRPGRARDPGRHPAARDAHDARRGHAVAARPAHRRPARRRQRRRPAPPEARAARAAASSSPTR